MLMVAACEAFSFSLPLIESIRIGKNEVRARQGFVIRVGSSEGDQGYGEVAPLPGLHRETLGMALEQYASLQPRLINQQWPKDVPDLLARFSPYPLCPALRYGLEMALLNLLAASKAVPLAGLLNPHYQKKLPINGLCWDDADDVDLDAQAQQLLAQGYRTLKLKVARQSLQKDIHRVRGLRARLGDQIALRLDANRRWDLDTAVRFGKAVGDCGIAYIEEPCSDPRQFSAFHRATSIAVALDETLGQPDFALATQAQGVTAWVLKPALLGGLSAAFSLMEMAKRLRLTAVISSTFDTGIGLAALAGSAAALGEAGTAAGLDTYRWLREDLLEEPFGAHGGYVDVVGSDTGARRLRESLLTQVC